MPTCNHTIQINASIQRVWQVLTDFEDYPNWNPLIGSIRGEVKENQWVMAYFTPLKLYVPVKIEAYQAHQTIVWKARLPHAYLMQGKHYYKLRPINEQLTELEHGEIFSGLLSKLFPAFLLSKIQDAYQYHNQKLKVIAENK